MFSAQNSERGETGYERTKQTKETNRKSVQLAKAFPGVYAGIRYDLYQCGNRSAGQLCGIRK